MLSTSPSRKKTPPGAALLFVVLCCWWAPWLGADPAVSREPELLSALARAIDADGLPTAGQLSPRQELARLYIEARRIDDAVAQLRYAAELGPLETDLAFWLSEEEFKAGRIPAANAQLRSVLARSDSSEAEYRLAGIARRQGRIKPALEHARRAVEFADADPTSTRLQLGLALEAHKGLAFDSGLYAEAMGSVLRLIELDPGMPQYAWHLGRILQAQGKRQEAIESLRHAVELAAEIGDPMAWLRRDLAIALVAENRFEEAKEYLQECLAISEGDLLTQATMASVEERLGEPQAALLRAQRVLAGGTTDPRPKAIAHLVIGRVHAGAGRFAVARDALEQAVEFDPDSATAHYQLSQACARLGDRECAAEHLALYRQAQTGPAMVPMTRADGPAEAPATEDGDDG